MLIKFTTAVQLTRVSWLTQQLGFGGLRTSLSACSESILGADRRSETDEQYRAEMTETDKQRRTAATSVEKEDKEKKGQRVRN